MQIAELLVRQPIPELQGEMEQLAHDVELLTGYSRLRKQLGCPGPLGQVLRKLEIQPYTEEAVYGYKKQKREDVLATLPCSYREHLDWKRFPLAQYAGELPPEPHVILRVVTIAKAMPDVRFWIDELVVPKFAEGCPFLVVTRGDEEYCVDQWDEPEMEGQGL